MLAPQQLEVASSLSKESIKTTHFISDLEDYMSQDKLFECCCEIQMGSFNCVIVGMYEIPHFENSEFLNRLNHCIERLLTKEKH